MVQFVNDPGVGERLGSAFGQGIQGALQHLAEQKLKDRLEEHQSKLKLKEISDLAKTFEKGGYAPEDAQFLAEAQVRSPKTVEQLMKRGYQPQMRQQDQQAITPTQDALNGLSTNMQPSNAPNLQDILNQVTQSKEFLAQTPEQQLALKQQFSNLAPTQTAAAVPAQGSPVSATSAPARRLTPAEALAKPYESPELKFRREQGEKELEQKEEKTAIELNKDAIKKYEDQLDEAPKRRAKFKRMEKLIDSGKVQFGLTGKGLLSIGKANKETQEVQKFIKDSIADYVKKGILTDTKAGILEDSMINLMQSKEGAQQVLYQLQQFNELEYADAQAYEEVKKRHKNRIPRDLSSEVRETAKIKKDEIYKNIESGLEGTVKAGAPVSSVPAAKRAYGQAATNPKTGQQLNWNGSEWIPREQWNLLNKGA